MRPITVSAGPLAAASANAIALSQTPGAAGALTLNGADASGGVATLDHPRPVLITTTGDEHTKSFVLTGTDWAGSPISETITGIPSGTAQASVLSYATVARVTISAAAAGALTVGTNGVASSPWVRLDEWATPSTVIQINVVGTVNYTVQLSMDDPNSPTNPVAPNAMTWINAPDLNIVGQTAVAQSVLPFIPTFARAVLNSGTGSVTATISQAGVVPY